MNDFHGTEAAFETVIEARLRNGYVPVARKRAIALLREHCAALNAAAVTGQFNMGEFPA